MRPMRRTVALTLALGAVAMGCGADDAPLPAACTADAGKVIAALRAAPGPVRLEDGTTLSRCVTAARSDGDLEGIGLVFTEAADRLSRAAERSAAAALRLGYLAGAVERGAKRTGGPQVDLARRIQSVAPDEQAPHELRAAYDQGVVAGRGRG